MAEVRIPKSQDLPDAPRPERPEISLMRQIAADKERISFGANLVATLASFVFLLIGQLVSLSILYTLLDDGDDARSREGRAVRGNFFTAFCPPAPG